MDLKLSGVSKKLPPKGRAQTLSVKIIAFGFKHGAPQGLDLLFDVRFLRNPNYVPELQPLTGDFPEVAAYIEQDAAAGPFLKKLFDFIDFLLPHFSASERSEITIGIGCTGGRHRSIYIANRLYAHLKDENIAPLEFVKRDAAR